MSEEQAGEEPRETGDKKVAMAIEPRQWAALRVRLTGGSVAEAADAADVHRTTVYRWHQDDPAYQAAYNQMRQALQDEFRQRLMDTAQQAVGAVRRAVEAGDIERSFRLLEGLGVLDGRSPHHGPTSAEKIKQEIFLEGLEIRSWDDGRGR